MIAAKIANCRTVLMRAGREKETETLARTVNRLANMVKGARACEDWATLRGVEGAAADMYFSAFSLCQNVEEPTLLFTKRSKRPPLDAINALMSFCYAMLAHDARSALESCGLDAAVGFLHRDRPGRPGLALDLMEEFRPVLADRLALTLINKKQLGVKDFEYQESGAVLLKEESRKKVITAWQERKQEVVIHPVLEEKMTWGLFIHVQARLLARYLRGDSEVYPAFLWK